MMLAACRCSEARLVDVIGGESEEKKETSGGSPDCVATGGEKFESVDALKEKFKLAFDGPSEVRGVSLQITEAGLVFLTNTTDKELLLPEKTQLGGFGTGAHEEVKDWVQSAGGMGGKFGIPLFKIVTPQSGSQGDGIQALTGWACTSGSHRCC